MDKYPKEFIKQISAIENIDCFFEKDMSKLSTMRLKSKGDLFQVRSIEALQELLKIFSSFEVEYIVLGLGANMLLPERAQKVYLQLKIPFDKSYLNSSRGVYTIPASVKLSVLSSHAIKFGLSGWESFTGIPATLGGAVYMNAGTSLGEIGSIIKSVQVISKAGEIKNITIDSKSFSYRKNHFLNKGDLIVSVTMKHFGSDDKVSKIIQDYLNLRNRTQPLSAFTCGCVFKNSNLCQAGRLIDLLGLKGLRIGNIIISEKHANFMENIGNGTQKDVLTLISIVQKEVFLNFGIKLETEAIMFN